ncbi:MAG: hypothetical protein LQ345_004770 [Seirophora villosa]|nr:MAG: hypothetical protein LQ345_004770 [Seirophora villosa]
MNAVAFQPPPHPPPLLDETQVLQLANKGYLALDIPKPLSTAVSELFDHTRDFFTLSTSDKQSRYPSAEGTELGYYQIPREKEYLTYRHCPSISSRTPLDLAAASLWSLAAPFLHRILSDLSLALDIPLSAWDPLLDGCLSMPNGPQETTPTLLRLFNYFPASGAAERHTDTGLLTLCIGTAPGLEVWSPASSSSATNFGSSPEGDWISAHPHPTILVGKTLQWLSNGRLVAGPHRVVASSEGRQSIVFALRPSLRRRYFDLNPFGERSVVDLVGVWGQIRGSVFNVNAQTAIRTEQKERMRARGLLWDEVKLVREREENRSDEQSGEDSQEAVVKETVEEVEPEAEEEEPKEGSEELGEEPEAEEEEAEEGEEEPEEGEKEPK